MNIPLGFEIGTGKRVDIPVGHTIVLGQTQLSGKTTTLQAMTERSGVCAIAFITKRGEKSFRNAKPIPPYFTETSVMQPYWKFVVSLLEGTQDIRLGFREKGWVMQLCRDYELSKTETDAKGKKKRKSCEWEEPKSLRGVLENARKALDFTKGVNELICIQLVEYLQMAVPEIESAKLSDSIKLEPGINVMDISKLSINVQSLVLRSVVEWVYTKRRRTIVIIPEAWKFLPEGRSTPVTFPVEELIRQGAALQNYVWIDLQDLRGIKKLLLRSIQVWLFGVQREKNEVVNTLKSMPTPEHKPSASEMMQLGIGQFIAAYGNELRRVYVWPAGMEETQAEAIALGVEDATTWKRIERALHDEEKNDQEKAENPGGSSDAVGVSGLPGVQPLRPDEISEGEEEMWKEKYEALKSEFDELREAHDAMTAKLAEQEDRIAKLYPDLKLPPPFPFPAPPSNGHQDLDAIYRYVTDRAAKDPLLFMKLTHPWPEMTVEMQKQTVNVESGKLQGRLALLIARGFFDSPKNGNAAFNELKRIGASVAKPNVYRELNKLAEMGFLTSEETGFLVVKSMKVNIVEGGK